MGDKVSTADDGMSATDNMSTPDDGVSAGVSTVDVAASHGEVRTAEVRTTIVGARKAAMTGEGGSRRVAASAEVPATPTKVSTTSKVSAAPTTVTLSASGHRGSSHRHRRQHPKGPGENSCMFHLGHDSTPSLRICRCPRGMNTLIKIRRSAATFVQASETQLRVEHFSTYMAANIGFSSGGAFQRPYS